MISSLKRLVEQGKIGKEEVTVAYITGNGLKTMEAMGDFVHPVDTTPDYETFHTALADSQGRL